MKASISLLAVRVRAAQRIKCRPGFSYLGQAGCGRGQTVHNHDLLTAAADHAVACALSGAGAWIGSWDAFARPADRRRRARGGLPRDPPRWARRGRGARRRRAARAARGAPPGRADRPAHGPRRARRRGDARPRAQPVAALLRLRDRRGAAGGARRRRRGRRLGPERRRLLGVARRVGRRGGRGRLAARAARPPGGRLVRPDHRLPAGARDLPGGGAQRRARGRGVGRRGPAGCRARRAYAWWSAPSATSRSTGRCGSSASAPTRWCP